MAIAVASSPLVSIGPTGARPGLGTSLVGDRRDALERRRVMDLNIALGYGGWVVLIAGAVILGGLAQFIGKTETGYEWLPVALAVGFGAIVASEFIVDWRAFEPVYDGLALVPALIGGLVGGVVIDALTRYVTGGTYLPASSAA
jgi:hypothetical protein